MTPLEHSGRWYNSRWFIVLSTLTILWTIGFLVMFRVRMQSQKEPNMEEQVFVPEETHPFLSLDGSVAEFVNTAPAVMVAWNPVSTAQLYEFSYVALPLAPQTIQTPVTTLTVTGLSFGTTYDFKVRAFSGNGTIPGQYSPEIHYTTATQSPTPSPTPTATFTPRPTATATASATFTPTATATFTPTATATFTPTPTSSATVTATATVAPTPSATPSPSPDFSITIIPPSLSAAPQGGYLTWSVNIAKSGGYSAPVILSHDLTLPGIASRFSPDPIPTSGSNSTATFIIFTGFIPSGSYPFTVTGQSFEPNPITRSATATLVKP